MTQMPSLGLGVPAHTAPTTYHEHPGEAVPMGCPNCQDTQHLVIDVPTVVHHVVAVWGIPGVTEPEFDVTDSDGFDKDAPIVQIDKVRCLTCRWSFTGQLPLTKLQPVT